MQRLLLLLSSDQPDQLEDGLQQRRGALSALAAGVGGTLRLAVQLEGDPMAGEGAGEARTIRSVHGVVDITVPGDDAEPLVPLAGAVRAELDGLADWSRSAVSIGQVHEVLPTHDDTLVLTLAANRLPSIDRAQFHDYWLHTHAPLALTMLDDAAKARMGYQQVHTDDAASARAGETAGVTAATFDGVLQVGLAQVGDLPHLTVPGFAEVIMKDEENFADQSAEMFGGFTRTLAPGGATA